MNLLFKNGSVSYELVGKFLTGLPKEKDLDLLQELKKVGSKNSVEEISPVLEFFSVMGHCDFNLEENKIRVHLKRKSEVKLKSA